MKISGIALLALCFVVPAMTAFAADEAPADTTTTRLENVEVQAPGLTWGDAALSDANLRNRQGDNLGENLTNLPGVAAVRRAASANEIVIRGLGWERVKTVLGAVPLYGACPGRMDPPATYLTPLSTSEVTIFRQGGGSFSGPGGTGGAIVANPDYEREPGDATGVTPWVGMGYESARDGLRYEGGLFGGSEAVDYKFGLGHRVYDDYTAPDGTLVPAGQTATSAAGSIGWRPGDNKRLWYAATYTHEQDIDFPAMPMDNIDTDFWVHNLGWRLTQATGLLRKFELTAGVSLVDHLMDNSMKPTRAAMENSTDAETRSAAAHASFDLAPGETWRLATGINATRLTRDAIRTRKMVMTDMTAYDRLWPDAVQLSTGTFANLTKNLGGTTSLNLNSRVDIIDSKARATDAASLGGLTVGEQYIKYYGEAAADHDKTETLGLIDFGVQGELHHGIQWYARTGISTRTAGISERYYAFGPAPGGFQVGNPTLTPEKKMEGELGFTFASDKFTVSMSGYTAKVSDYILPSVIDKIDVNGDNILDTIKGFTNVDATLNGGELGLEYRPLPTVYVPVTVSYVRGKNTSEDRDLPEIPPLFGSAEVRWLTHGSSKTWLRGGCTFAADQDKIDPLFPEDRTGGYTVWHVGVETTPLEGWRFGVQIDNLFDKLYNDHLMREAVMATGDLVKGGEIPSPGRSVSATMRVEF